MKNETEPNPDKVWRFGHAILWPDEEDVKVNTIASYKFAVLESAFKFTEIYDELVQKAIDLVLSNERSKGWTLVAILRDTAGEKERPGYVCYQVVGAKDGFWEFRWLNDYTEYEIKTGYRIIK